MGRARQGLGLGRTDDRHHPPRRAEPGTRAGCLADEDRAEGPRSEAGLANNAIPAPCSYMPDTMSRSPEAISFAASGVPMAHLGRASCPIFDQKGTHYQLIV